MSEEAHLNGFHTLDISQETPWAWGKPVKADGGGHSKTWGTYFSNSIIFVKMIDDLTTKYHENFEA